MGFTIDFFGKSSGSGDAVGPAGWTALFVMIGREGQPLREGERLIAACQRARQ